MTKVSPQIQWALAATLGLTIYSLWSTKPSSVDYQKDPNTTAVQHPVPNAGSIRVPVEPLWLEEALGKSVDLFAPPGSTEVQRAPTPKPTVPQHPHSAAAQLTPAPAMTTTQQAPALTARYLGSVSDPSGQLLHFLQDQQQVLLAKPGLAVSNGYVVERVELQVSEGTTVIIIQFFHAALAHRETMRLNSMHDRGT